MNIASVRHGAGLPQEVVSGKKFSSELAKAGAQFESLLLTDIFSKLRQSFSLEEEEHSDAGSDTLSGLADQALCEGLAARGGVGLGKLITRAVAERNR